MKKDIEDIRNRKTLDPADLRHEHAHDHHKRMNSILNETYKCQNHNTQPAQAQDLQVERRPPPRGRGTHAGARVKIFNWWADQKGRVTNEVLEQMWKDIMDYKREWPDLRL